MVRSGHSSSPARSRCMRRSGASARSLITLLALRRRQALSGTTRSPTVTPNPPSTRRRSGGIPSPPSVMRPAYAVAGSEVRILPRGVGSSRGQIPFSRLRVCQLRRGPLQLGLRSLGLGDGACVRLLGSLELARGGLVLAAPSSVLIASLGCRPRPSGTRPLGGLRRALAIVGEEPGAAEADKLSLLVKATRGDEPTDLDVSRRRVEGFADALARCRGLGAGDPLGPRKQLGNRVSLGEGGLAHLRRGASLAHALAGREELLEVRRRLVAELVDEPGGGGRLAQRLDVVGLRALVLASQTSGQPIAGRRELVAREAVEVGRRRVDVVSVAHE